MNEKEAVEKEVADILKPQFETTGRASFTPSRPVMQPVPETPPETPETPKPQFPLRTVSERLSELEEHLGMIESKIDLMIAVLR